MDSPENDNEKNGFEASLDDVGLDSHESTDPQEHGDGSLGDGPADGGEGDDESLRWGSGSYQNFIGI